MSRIDLTAAMRSALKPTKDKAYLATAVQDLSMNMSVTSIPTGSTFFDLVTGVGGLPQGRIVEAFGEHMSGKSTAFYMAIAQAQAMGGAGLVLDYENAFTTTYASMLGLSVDPRDLTLIQDPLLSLEDGFLAAKAATEAATEADVPLVVVFDSLAFMRPAAEIGPDAKLPGEDNMAGAKRAKLISDYLALYTGLIGRSPAVWCFVNHEKIVIDTGGGPPRYGPPPKRTPGGASVAYAASIRFRFIPSKKITGPVLNTLTGQYEDGEVARFLRIQTPKNKVAPPHREVSVILRHGQGIDNVASLFEAAVARGIIQKQPGGVYVIGEVRVRGEANALEHFRASPGNVTKVEEHIRTTVEREWRGSSSQNPKPPTEDDS